MAVIMQVLCWSLRAVRTCNGPSHRFIQGKYLHLFSNDSQGTTLFTADLMWDIIGPGEKPVIVIHYPFGISSDGLHYGKECCYSENSIATQRCSIAILQQVLLSAYLLSTTSAPATLSRPLSTRRSHYSHPDIMLWLQCHPPPLLHLLSFYCIYWRQTTGLFFPGAGGGGMWACCCCSALSLKFPRGECVSSSPLSQGPSQFTQTAAQHLPGRRAFHWGEGGFFRCRCLRVCMCVEPRHSCLFTPRAFLSLCLMLMIQLLSEVEIT